MKKGKIINFPLKSRVCPGCLGYGKFKVIGPRDNVIIQICNLCNGKGKLTERDLSHEKPS